MNTPWRFRSRKHRSRRSVGQLEPRVPVRGRPRVRTVGDPNTRETVNEAADGTYRAENTSDTAFRSLLETFHSHTAVSANTASGPWITRYEG
jgi:hypothetical protein